MLDSILTAWSGMTAFSKGLTVISNNVANLNTPGFKTSELAFQSQAAREEITGQLANATLIEAIGTGVMTRDTHVNFAQGEIQGTGTATDAAIDGKGYFVIRNEEETLLTRVGQFQIDAQGRLTTQDGKYRVAGMSASGELQDISIEKLRASRAKQTTKILFQNNLSSTATTHSVSNVPVIDAAGTTHLFSLTFTSNSSVATGSWLVEVKSDTGASIASGVEIRFATDGSPLAGFNSFIVSYTPTGGSPMDVQFYLGDPGSLSGSTSFAAGTTSTLGVGSQDGYPTGLISTYAFDGAGNLTIQYSNGQTAHAGQLALAEVADEASLVPQDGARFRAPANATLRYGTGTNFGLGTVQGGKIELSNVDLTKEFTNLIIQQRGFQASSQVITTANSLIDEALKMGRNGA